MSDRYLWDRSGAPDPEVQRLERLLGRFAHRATPPGLPRRPVWRQYLAVAASVLVAASGAWLMWEAPPDAWTVSQVAGAPRAAAREIRGSGKLAVGEWLETDSRSQARLQVAAIGELSVGPDTRLRLDRTRGREHRVSLERGSITAFIYAPARTFFVNTPAATAVDLGCKYELEVDAAGSGRLRVIMGWVGFEKDGRESFIPEGAYCLTRRGALGTPFYEDSTAAFQNALRRFDFERGSLDAILPEARKRDALTLWHLLARVSPEEFLRVYARLAELVPPPAGVRSEGFNKGMQDSWWDALGLENIGWWRKWKGLAPPVGSVP